MPPPFQLTLFGQARLEGPQGVIDLNSRKLCGLLAYLACSGPRGHTRERLMTLLWGSHGEAQARQNLRQALHRLRSFLGKSAILSNGEQISLEPASLACDVVEFEGLLEAGDLDARRRAIALYSGPLLADIAITEPAWEEWLTTERQRLEQQALKAMIDVATAELETHNAETAIETAGRALAINPLREDAHRLVLQALVAAGRSAEALSHYGQLERTLRSELGVAPDAATFALVAELRAGKRQAPTLQAPPQNVPAPAHDSGSTAQTAAAAVDQPTRTDVGVHSLAAELPAVRLQRRSFARPGLLIGACILLAAAGLTTVRPWSNELTPNWAPGLTSGPNQHKVPIAVLPIRPLTPGIPAAASYAAHMEEEIANYLSQFPMLQVPSPQMMREALKSEKLLFEGSKAGIRYAIGGSIWVDQGNLRLSVHMVDLSRQLQVWSKQFEHPIAEWPEQREFVLRKIAIAANFETVRREGARPYADAEHPTVPELLARGWRGLLAAANTQEFAEAGTYFSEALNRDASSTNAMIGLAGYKLTATANMLGDWQSQTRDAEALLRNAMHGGAESFTVHYYLGILYNLRNDLPTALEHFERTVALNPSFGPGHAHKGRVLIKMSRYAEALESVSYAYRLTDGKLAAGWALWRAIALLELGQEQKAGEAFLYAAEAQPQNPYFIAGIAAFHALNGHWEAVRRHVIDLRARTPGRSDAWRLWHLNPGPDKLPLPNRFGRGLQLAFEAVPEQKAEAPP
ncbi:MAG: hypothetical protein J0I75_19410 [Hyphomicrobium sp.]|nr:hypothetical protein [Hyphomicrobium sp.]